MKKPQLFATLLAGMLATGTLQAADIISLNGTLFNTSVHNVDGNYGVASFGSVAGNWNNVDASPANTGDLTAGGAAGTLNLNDGSTATGVSWDVTWGLSQGATNSNTGAANGTPMKSGWGATNTNATELRISGLGSNFTTDGYLAIVYLTGFSGSVEASVTASDGTTSYDTYYWDNTDTSGASLVQTTDTVAGGTVVPASYAVFGSASNPITSSEFTFIVANSSAAGTAGIGGIQIVAVPEPGTFALLAGMTGLVYVMLRRRRR